MGGQEFCILFLSKFNVCGKFTFNMVNLDFIPYGTEHYDINHILTLERHNEAWEYENAKNHKPVKIKNP